MKKIADFIVNKRRIVLSCMLVLCVLCGVLALRVEINADMSTYLPEDSGMRQGLSIMETEFPAVADSYSIRVMFTGLPEGEKSAMREALGNIPHVDSVLHEEGSDAYNSGAHTLYKLETSFDYGSPQEASIEKALRQDFAQYDMVFRNDDIGMEEIPVWILVLAVVILMVILLIMCSSWVEPLLFLATIGIAVVLNLGTNIIMGSVSEITFSIAAILQLILSMDYSIILLNRYREEKGLTEDRPAAMKAALLHAFSSIASSALTTVVGLLALVFMRFQIGMDLGIVLAKGVAISMVCVFTVLPCLILASDKLIEKTAKRSPSLNMAKFAAFSSKYRYVITGFFVVLLACVSILQGNAQYAYELESNDPIVEVFPADSPLVMVYENRDEAAIEQLAELLAQDERVTEVNAYATTLGKEYTAAELAAQLEGIADMPLDASLLNIIYYDYYADGETGKLTVSAFMDFLTREVLPNELFAQYISDDMQAGLGMLQAFADPSRLAQPLTAAEMRGCWAWRRRRRRPFTCTILWKRAGYRAAR